MPSFELVLAAFLGSFCTYVVTLTFRTAYVKWVLRKYRHLLSVNAVQGWEPVWDENSDPADPR